MKVKSSDSSAMLAILMEAIEMEAHGQLMLHCAHRYLKAVKFAQHKQLGEYGEQMEEFVETLMRQVFRLNGTVQYDAGTITSPDISKSPSDNVVEVFKASLDLVNELADKCEDWCQKAWDAKSEDCRHDFKDLLDAHHKQSIWLTAQIRWIDDIGGKEYVASGGMVG